MKCNLCYTKWGSLWICFRAVIWTAGCPTKYPVPLVGGRGGKGGRGDRGGRGGRVEASGSRGGRSGGP